MISLHKSTFFAVFSVESCMLNLFYLNDLPSCSSLNIGDAFFLTLADVVLFCYLLIRVNDRFFVIMNHLNQSYHTSCNCWGIGQCWIAGLTIQWSRVQNKSIKTFVVVASQPWRSWNLFNKKNRKDFFNFTK